MGVRRIEPQNAQEWCSSQMKNFTRRKFIHKAGLGAVQAPSVSLAAADGATRETARVTGWEDFRRPGRA